MPHHGTFATSGWHVATEALDRMLPGIEGRATVMFEAISRYSASTTDASRTPSAGIPSDRRQLQPASDRGFAITRSAGT